MFEKKQLLPKIKHNSSILIFILIAAWYAVTNFIWWHINTPNFPCYDSAAVHFLYIFKQYKSNNPLIIWIIQYLLSVFGNNSVDAIIIIVNYIFFIISLYFIYKIGKEIDSKETGNTAMILFALVPAVYGLSRQFGHKDYHIIAAMTANIYFLIKTDSFKYRKWSLLYGISAGIGLLIKDTILIYLLAPFFWTSVIALKEKFEKRKLINILISLISGTIIAGWIVFQPHSMRKVFYDPITLVVPIFSFESLRVMTLCLYDELLSPPIFLLFLFGLRYFIKYYHNKNKILFIIWIFIPWSIIFVMPHYKLSEYFTGFVPSIVLICSVFLSHIERPFVKKLLFIFLIAIGIIQYINFSYFPTNLFSKMRIKIYGTDIMYYRASTENIMNFDVKNRCAKISKVVRLIKKEFPAASYSVYVTTKSEINNKAFRVCMLLNGMDCDVDEIEKFKIRPEDKIIVISGHFLSENLLQRHTKMMENHPMLVEELKLQSITVSEYLNEYDKQIREQMQFINKNFDLAKIFYFNDEINANNEITILTRKHK